MTFEDLLDAWVGLRGIVNDRDARRRRNQKFVIIADSCYSGQLVERLKREHKERRQRRELPLNMAIQASCSRDETASDGLFTRCFVDWQQGYQFDFREAVPKPELCPQCEGYYNQNCRYCRNLKENYGLPSGPDEIQHPVYFVTWAGDSSVVVGGMQINFLNRGNQTVM